MRPWRDIVSTGAWETIVQKNDSTARASRGRRLRAALHTGVETPKRNLERMAGLIRAYHLIPKTEFGRMDDRVNALAEISAAAARYLTKFRVDIGQAKQRVEEKYSGVHGWSTEKLQRHGNTGRYEAGNAIDQSIDRTVLTLLNRGLRKAGYLRQLKQYYQAESRDPKALVAALSRPQDKGATHTGLHAGVRMEAIDPWHRPVEVSFKNGQVDDGGGLQDEYSSSAAFGQWYQTIGQHNLPFFLWLEGHPICTADDKAMIAATASVAYVSRGDAANGYASVAPRHKLCMVYPHGGKLWLDELKPNGVTRLADTDGYSCNSGKGVSDAAAFMWTGREITVAQHQESGFHHSSFNSGGTVQCAGMIKISGGFITYVSNNSGHYRPDKRLLHRFVATMSRRGMLAPGCEVQCSGVSPSYRNTAQHFLTHWATL